MNRIKKFTENISKKEEIEDKIIQYLNDADANLSKIEFNMLAESIIDYIDEIGRNKR